MTKSRARKFADIMGGTFVGLIEDGQIDIVDVDGLSAIQTKVNGIEANATTDQTAAEIKTAYESNSNTNEFSDAEQSKLAGIEAGATGDQSASEIRSLVEAATDSNVFTDADHSKLDGIASGATNTVGNATHTGEVTGSGALTIASNVVDADNLKVTGNGTTSQYLRSDGDGTFTWATPPNTTYSVGDGGLTQINFTSADNTKLDGIATSANNYSFPYTVSQSESNLTVVQRNDAGYLFANYFNGSGTFNINGYSSGMGNFTGNNGSDTYGRSYNAAAARTLLNVANGATNVTNNNQISNGAGYTTNVGDITGVTAGSNLTGGGTSGTVSLALVSGPTFSGTVTATAFAGDGSALTGVGGSTAWGAVGTYGYMFWNGAGSQNPGATVSGGSLYPANGFSYQTTAGYSTATGTQSGTWRLMGETGRYNGGSSIHRADMWSSLFVRIS